MADQAAAAPAKKKSKLPLILVIVVVLAGGGFFAMSSGGKKEEKKKPAIALGEVESLGQEFLVRLSDGRTYLKADISVHVAKDEHLEPHTGEDGAKKDDGHAKKGEEKPNAIVRDVVNKVLMEADPKEISTPEGVELLKEKIAWAINHRLHALSAEDEGDSKKRKKDDHGGHEAFKPVPDEDKENPSWHSDEGPALIIYFNSFVTMTY